MNNKYEYMLSMPHHQSKKRKHMPLSDRAAQFGAFRALTGYEDAIAETGRLTDEKLELDENQKEEINLKLQYLFENIEDNLAVSVIYFEPDERKQGGKYLTYTGKIEKIKEYEKQLIFEDGTIISIEDIYLIEI